MNKAEVSSRARRLSLIKEIEKRRGSRVITYITGDRLHLNLMIEYDAVNAISSHLIQNKIEANSKVDLLIYSRGGVSDVPWTLVSKFREYSPKGSFNVLVPYKCHSAGTVIALGADEIVMTKEAEFTPIDATMMNPHNPTIKQISVEDVNSYFSLLKRLSNKGDSLSEESVLSAFKDLSAKVEPLLLGSVNRTFEQTMLVATRCMNTRNIALDGKKAKEIVKKLSSEIFSHRHTIARTEAKKDIGLENIKNAEEYKIDDLLWQLYVEYEEYLKLQSPFTPDQYLIEKKLNEYSWNDMAVGCIESKNRLDVKRRSVSIKKIKNIPNNVNFAVNGLNLPPLTIASQSGEILDNEGIKKMFEVYVKQTVAGIVKSAIDEAKNQFLASLPDQGFQRTDINHPWLKQF